MSTEIQTTACTAVIRRPVLIVCVVCLHQVYYQNGEDTAAPKELVRILPSNAGWSSWRVCVSVLCTCVWVTVCVCEWLRVCLLCTCVLFVYVRCTRECRVRTLGLAEKSVKESVKDAFLGALSSRNAFPTSFVKCCYKNIYSQRCFAWFVFVYSTRDFNGPQLKRLMMDDSISYLRELLTENSANSDCYRYFDAMMAFVALKKKTFGM